MRRTLASRVRGSAEAPKVSYSIIIPWLVTTACTNPSNRAERCAKRSLLLAATSSPLASQRRGRVRVGVGLGGNRVMAATLPQPTTLRSRAGDAH